MRTDFLPKRQFMPGGAASAAGGATPWGAIAQGALGLAQTIGGWIQQRRATKQLERMQSPTYKQNQSILDYYNQALQRYNVSPTDSAMYKRQMRDIDRGVATGINALQDRRSGLAGASSILRAANDAKLNANVAAEQEKNQRFGVLGQATNMKAGEDRMAFDINENQPFERKYNLLAMKAGGGNSILNAGLSNIFNAGQNISNMGMLDKMYGSGTGSGGGSSVMGAYNPGSGVTTDWLLRNRKMKLPK